MFRYTDKIAGRSRQYPPIAGSGRAKRRQREPGSRQGSDNATASDADKAQAESIAKSYAGTQVVSDQIAVRPPGDESIAKKVDSDLDSGIEKNFDAILVRHKLDSTVKYDVKNGVITLNGKVNSQSKRAWVQKLATAVPNVRQVVNELQVKGQKATSSD